MHENLGSVKKTVFWAYFKYVQWNYSEDRCKNCKTELQWFTVPCTSICHTEYNAEDGRWYNNQLYFKFIVISLHLEQQSNGKNTMENCKLDYSGLLYFVHLFPCVPYLQCSENICRVSKSEKLECPTYVFYSILHRNFLIWCKYLHAYYLGCYILLKDDLLVCHF